MNTLDQYYLKIDKFDRAITGESIWLYLLSG
jgi:hypothetical protein